jgi:hypothetical protein
MRYSEFIVRSGNQTRADRSTLRLLLALVCVLLVAVCGTLQITHTHSDGDISHANCSICATAHVVVQVSLPPIGAPALAVVTIVEQRHNPIRPATLATFALFTRPPPVDIVPA